jgi:ADP-heptose:LPS heptosyltransferase
MDYTGEKMTVFSTPSDREAAESLIKSIADTKEVKGFSALIPGAYRPTRRWNRDGFVSVGRYLIDQYGLGVLVFGTRDEEKIVSYVTENIPGAVAIYDVEPRVMFEVFRVCDIIITNDTGPMHIAASAENPGIVSIFGPENPNRYAPYGENLRVEVISGEAECSPCTLFSCDRMDCMKGIGPEAVKAAIDRLMGRR